MELLPVSLMNNLHNVLNGLVAQHAVSLSDVIQFVYLLTHNICMSKNAQSYPIVINLPYASHTRIDFIDEIRKHSEYTSKVMDTKTLLEERSIRYIV